MKFGKARGAIGAIVLVAASLGLALGCDTGTSPATTDTTTAASTYKDYLYMTDTVSGKVYSYDPATQAASSSSIATTGQNASGEIQFYKGIGYVAVGSGTNKGVYYFDPSATNPAFTKLGASIAAQYFTFSSSTKAYVSSYDYSGTTSGLYSFNPSSPSSGLAAIASTSGKCLQEIVLGPDGYLYTADNGNGAVIKIDPATDAVMATIATSALGTTGLVKGAFNGSSGVFVANSGGYATTSPYAQLPSSIDFISSSGSLTTVVAASASTPIAIARVVQLADGNLVATGYNHSYLVTISGSSATVTEFKNSSGSSFGALDIAYKGGLVYIPVAVTSDYISYKNYLYVLDASGAQKSYSPVSVMTASEGLSNIGFWE
jgi:hypothetical protein